MSPVTTSRPRLPGWDAPGVALDRVAVVDHVAHEQRTDRMRRRQLDGEFWSEDWLLAG